MLELKGERPKVPLSLDQYAAVFAWLWRQRLSGGRPELDDPEKFAGEIGKLEQRLGPGDRARLGETDESGRTMPQRILDELLDDPAFLNHPLAQARRTARSGKRARQGRRRVAAPGVTGELFRLLRRNDRVKKGKRANRAPNRNGGQPG